MNLLSASLSPSDETVDPSAVGLPLLAGTEAWGRRLLNTQLASWAELRHDTILYAKQSYTGGGICEFPDAYVDPYPQFYGAIVEFAAESREIVRTLEPPDTSCIPAPPCTLNSCLPPCPSQVLDRVDEYFARLGEAALMLEEMAEFQRAGTPFTDGHMNFVNDTVRIQYGCAGPQSATGWFAKLYFDVGAGIVFDPTIADVHTQPYLFDTRVGRVLHVGTGKPRLMVVTIDSCTGPRAYVGLVSSYFEQITEDFERLDDPTWAREVLAASPQDVPWMRDLVVR